MVFSCKGFHLNMMFFFISYFFIVPLIITFDIIIMTRIPMTLVLEHIDDHLFNFLSRSYNFIRLNRPNTNKCCDDKNQNVVLRRHNHPPHQDDDNPLQEIWILATLIFCCQKCKFCRKICLATKSVLFHERRLILVAKSFGNEFYFFISNNF